MRFRKAALTAAAGAVFATLYFVDDSRGPMAEASEAAGKLVWTSTSLKLDNRPVTYFSYMPGLGLTDLDFHPINEQGWKNMSSRGPEAVAMLEVPASTALTELQSVIEALEKRGYRTIAVSMRR